MVSPIVAEMAELHRRVAELESDEIEHRQTGASSW
jgi:hypothetical protein